MKAIAQLPPATCPEVDYNLWTCGSISAKSDQVTVPDYAYPKIFSTCRITVNWQEQICTYNGIKFVKVLWMNIEFPNSPTCTELKDYVKDGPIYRQDRMRDLFSAVLSSLAELIATREGIRDCTQYPSIHIYSSWASCGYYVGSGRDSNGHPTSWDFEPCGGESQCCYSGRFCKNGTEISKTFGWVLNQNTPFCVKYLPPLPEGKTAVTECGPICGETQNP